MGWSTGVPPRQPDISTTIAAVTSRAPAPSPRTNAREPVTVPWPLDQASSPSQEANITVPGGGGGGRLRRPPSRRGGGRPEDPCAAHYERRRRPLRPGGRSGRDGTIARPERPWRCCRARPLGPGAPRPHSTRVGGDGDGQGRAG